MARATTLPRTMRAAALDRFGGPDVLTLHTLPLPDVDPGDVLIAVHTAGVGGWDADMRGGWLPDGKPRFPLVLGSDGSGAVAAVGGRVRRFAVGDPVYAFSFNNPGAGFYAEYVAVPADNVASLPRGLDLVHAGAMPATGLTALQGVDDALHLRRGESVIVHGGSGGVGSVAVQFAKLRGARVLATASGRSGVSLVKALGADEGIDGKRADITNAAERFAPDGIDAVLAFVGGPSLTACLNAVRRGGRLAYPNGIEPAPRKRRGLHLTPYDAEAGPRQLSRLSRAVEAAALEVPIAASYTLAHAARAHARIARGHVLGKVVLRIR